MNLTDEDILAVARKHCEFTPEGTYHLRKYPDRWAIVAVVRECTERASIASEPNSSNSAIPIAGAGVQVQEDAPTYVTGFLCRAWGETDLPEAALVRTREEIIAFIIAAQFGETPLADLHEENRQIIKEQIAEMDMDVSSCDAAWQIDFEIGGISVERVTFSSRNSAIPGGAGVQAQGGLQVWFGCMPESNGKANWTAILHRGDLSEGHNIDRSEHHDRVRYEADRVRWLIGELGKAPDILDYDADMLNPEGWQHPCGTPQASQENERGSADSVASGSQTQPKGGA